jgi:hypothetical protein
MHQQDLRELTRKAAQRGQTKLKTRLSKGEKRNRKRMATVATVYTLEAHERTAEAIMGPQKEKGGNSHPRARNKRVWASVEREPEAVTQEVFQEALRRDPHKQRQWVMLVDGDEHQLDRILACIETYRADVIIVLDFIHVLEYLWKAAYCFHSQGSQEAETWVAERALEILKGGAKEVAVGMRGSATLRGLSHNQRQSVDKCANYLLKYRAILDYDQYLALGLPIATGVIEGACRHLVKDRMDLTGARWRLQSAEAVLKLRSLNASGDFEEYFGFHKAQELKRNHSSRYAEPPWEKVA